MERIHAAMHRVRQLLTLKPERGRRTVTSRFVLDERLRGHVDDGTWTLPVDMTPSSGGDGSAPDPGVYARAALAACVAITYRMWAAAERIELTDVQVGVEADNDASGLFGVGDTRAAYRGVRLTVTVTSPADPDDVARLLDLAEAHSPYLDLFRHGVPVQITRSIAQQDGCVARPADIPAAPVPVAGGQA